VTAIEYTAAFPFGGLGAGAAGILAARMSLMGREARFRCVGGFDFDAAACADFEYLTGAPEICSDVILLTPDVLRAKWGERAPDLVFLSPPCKGSSGLLSDAQSKTAKYREMNELALVWIRLMVRTWATPPRLVLFENVPRIKTRAAKMLTEVRRLLRQAGYVCRDGFHDCGEIGGLAQRRRRYLMVARLERSVSPILYQPVKKRVRACGEVLGPIPMPEDPVGGPMHRMPRISWLNWVRLALIPAGGDWRDLPGVLAEGQKRREKFERQSVAGWDEATGTVAGAGSNGVYGVADPRARELWEREGVKTPGQTCWFKGKYGVTGWEDPAKTVIGGPTGTTTPAIADPRIVGMNACKPGSYHNNYRVEDWQEPAHTVIGAGRPGSGAPSVADPRTAWFPSVLGVVPWSKSFGTVTGESRPSNGSFAVADPRVKTAFDHGYMVMPWASPSPTVAGKSHPGNGAYSVADPRLTCEPRAGAYGVLPWTEAAKTVTGAAAMDNGAWAVADPRVPDAPPLFVIENPRKPPTSVPVIIAADGTWHRPLTTLELAALQGLPTVVNGHPLKLHGSNSSAWRERIGNAVPPPAAQAIGERMLITLLQADFEAFSLSGQDSPVWVEPERYGDIQ
jgi:site-specific DNA-cytosine methylase